MDAAGPDAEPEAARDLHLDRRTAQERAGDRLVQGGSPQPLPPVHHRGALRQRERRSGREDRPRERARQGRPGHRRPRRDRAQRLRRSLLGRARAGRQARPRHVAGALPVRVGRRRRTVPSRRHPRRRIRSDVRCTRNVTVQAPRRGCHLVQDEVDDAFKPARDRTFKPDRTNKPGLANLLIRHTSASLTMNENADPTVRGDWRRR